jgi:electron transfer flavoprotein alpha/beta subunit
LAERGVATTPVIKYFDVFKQVRNRVSMRGVPSLVNSFVLQAVEEAAWSAEFMGGFVVQVWFF